MLGTPSLPLPVQQFLPRKLQLPEGAGERGAGCGVGGGGLASSAAPAGFLVSAGEGVPFSWGGPEFAVGKIRSFRLPWSLPRLTRGYSLWSEHRKLNSAVGNQPTMPVVLPRVWNRKETPF